MLNTLIVAAAMAAPATADTLQMATDLPDVEVVGVKQLPGAGAGLKTRVDDAQIRRLAIEGVRGVSQVAPNVYMPQYGSRMSASVYMRGLGARMDQPVVGLNVDNIPYLNKDAYDFTLDDMSRIDVLRGNAGILNGRNALAGQINIYTMSPWQYEGVRLGFEYGRANSMRASAGWYGRLGKTVAMSLTAGYGGTDGFFRNGHDGSHCGRERQGRARFKLSWHPHTRWSVANTASMGIGRQDGYPYQNVATGLISYNDSTFYKRASFADGLTVSYTGKRMIATSITSVQYLDDNMTLDQDFLPQDYFTITQKRHEWAWTQDLFAKGTRGRYNWLIGVFGFYKKSHFKAPVTFKDTGISQLIENNVNAMLPAGMQLRWDARSMLLHSRFDVADGGFAVYHQSGVDLGAWKIQAGLRYDIERVDLDYTTRVNTSATMGRLLPAGKWMPLQQQVIGIDNGGNLHQTFGQLLPQVSVSWQPSACIGLAASVAKGYKAGGYNTQMLSDVLQQQLMEQVRVPVRYDIEKMLTYKPEKSLTYELTANAANNACTLTASLTGFFISCRNQQLTVFPDGNITGRAMTNAGRTRSYGLEATAAWQIARPLSVNASYGYTHATFTQYNNGVADLKGKRVPYAPSHTLFVQAVWRLPATVLGVQPVLSADTRGTGSICWDDQNTFRQPFYATLGADLTFEHKLGSLSLWGKNLTGTRYATFWFESIGNRFEQRGEPWSIGATLRVNIAAKKM